MVGVAVGVGGRAEMEGLVVHKPRAKTGIMVAEALTVRLFVRHVKDWHKAVPNPN
jgi:hypothetical protein